MYVRDLAGNEYACQLTCTIDEELNGNITLGADVVPTKANNVFIDDLAEMWELVDGDEVEYKIIHVMKQGVGNRQQAKIKAIPLFFDDFSRLRIYEEYNQLLTAQSTLNIIFNGSGYNFVLNGTYEAKEWEGFGGGETRLDMFKKWLNRYGGEFGDIVGNTVYIDNLVGRDTSIMYRHRLNASNIVKEIDATNLFTYAKGYGNYEDSDEWEDAKLNREYTSPLAHVLGIRHAPPIKDGRIKNNSTMDKQLKALVDESLKISVSADIHDLTKQGYPIAQAKKGDRVFLIDERIGLKEEVRVVNINTTKDWRGRILDIQITFGSQSIVKRYQSNLNNSLQSIKDLLDGKVKLPFNVLDNAVIQATKALKDAQSELFFTENGILAVDKTNPNFVTLFNSAGIGVSVDGGSTFINAITGQGINANVIYTGSMLADRISGGILTSMNGRTVFNLNTGELTMQNAKFELGSGAVINFTSEGNKIQFSRVRGGVTRYSGLGVGIGATYAYPVTYLGTSEGTDYLDAEHNSFRGLITQSAKAINEGAAHTMFGENFLVRRNPSSDVGIRFRLNANEQQFYGSFADDNNYLLGIPNNRWAEVHAKNYYGTLASTSSHNAKMGIEDIDGEQAFDYFMQMFVKSFYYKNDDYTNKYNRKVSPIIEQLDPTLEKLYKSDISSLDINSNLFLLVKAFQYFVEKIENETGA